LNSDRSTYDLVFADPPFHLEGTGQLPALVRERKLLAPGGLLVIEHPRDTDLGGDPWFDRCRKYSNIHFSFFTPKTA
jgi:16S rRNA G966 N2-methylase RsmD